MSTRASVGVNTDDPTRPRLLEGLIQPPEWTEDAVCAQVDPDLFFPEKGGSTKAAKQICSSCPVQTQCLEYALTYESGGADTSTSYPAGIYGGLSERERRQLRKDRKAAAA